MRLLAAAVFVSKYVLLGCPRCDGGGWVRAVGACKLLMKVEWCSCGEHVVAPGPAPVDEHVVAPGLMLASLELQWSFLLVPLE